LALTGSVAHWEGVKHVFSPPAGSTSCTGTSLSNPSRMIPGAPSTVDHEQQFLLDVDGLVDQVR
jgi:hypothetical protein